MNNDRYGTAPGSLVQQLEVLWRRQCDEWEMLQKGRASLHAAMTRTFEVDGSHVVAQCNPARVRSAAAKVDAESLAVRPCFLCPENRPVEQRCVPYAGLWKVLCNPVPIFDPHFTIALAEHEPQLIRPSIGAMLDLARDLESRYTVFYNGPSSGASAPDHLHLQASPAGGTPFENELAVVVCAERGHNGQWWVDWVRRRDHVRIGVTGPGRRPAVVIMGDGQDDVLLAVREVLATLNAIHPAQPEPMLNLFATYADDHWLVWLFPRQAHRPSCYGQGPDRYLISPGAVDLAGMLIAPRREDFERLDAATIRAIYEEVSLSPDKFADLRDQLSR